MDEEGRLWRQALGEVTRSARIALGLSQTGLGQRCGRTQQGIAKIEKGEAAPSDMRTLAAALGLTLGEFAGRIDEQVTRLKTPPPPKRRARTE